MSNKKLCSTCRARQRQVVTAALMHGQYVGDLTAKNMKIGIVIGRFNEIVTRSLLEGALEAFQRHSCLREDIEVTFHPAVHSQWQGLVPEV